MDITIKHQGNAITKPQADTKFKELYNIVVHVNQLTSFPMSGDQIEDWCKSLLFLLPGLDFNALIFLINEMKLGNYDYDKSLGIQNLTKGLKCVKKRGEYYYMSQSSIEY